MYTVFLLELLLMRNLLLFLLFVLCIKCEFSSFKVSSLSLVLNNFGYNVLSKLCVHEVCWPSILWICQSIVLIKFKTIPAINNSLKKCLDHISCSSRASRYMFIQAFKLSHSLLILCSSSFPSFFFICLLCLQVY